MIPGRAINLASVDNASRREPPIVTASRMGQLEIAALLAAYGADLEARDGQVHSIIKVASPTYIFDI
jgi:hypothetical protein